MISCKSLPTTAAVSVSSLLCHRDLPMALICLGSLLANAQEPVHLILHDDGSLREEDVALLRERLGSPTIIRKSEADAIMAETLRRHPAAAEFRQTNVLAKKLLDCIHFNPSDEFAYCDTDILFVRPFSGLWAFPSADVSALMMSDMTNSYSMRSWQMARYPRLQIHQRPNSGLLLYRRRRYDLDFVEWFLSRPELRSVPYFTEQTIWALLCWRASCRLWCPEQIAFIKPGFTPTEQFVAGHFVSTYRSMFAGYTDKKFSFTAEPARIKTIPARRCTPLRFAVTELSRRAARLVQSYLP